MEGNQRYMYFGKKSTVTLFNLIELVKWKLFSQINLSIGDVVIENIEFGKMHSIALSNDLVVKFVLADMSTLTISLQVEKVNKKDILYL